MKKNNLLIRFVRWFLSSLDTYNKGASARKLTGLVITLLICYLHYNTNENDKIYLIIIDYVALFVMFGFIQAPILIELLTGLKNKNNEKDKTNNSNDDVNTNNGGT